MAGGFVSRGFGGLRRSPDESRTGCPPGQYFEQGFPVLTAGPTPDVDPRASGASAIDGMVAEEREWTWSEFGALEFEERPLRHPLRHQVVEARHQLPRRLARHPARGGRAARRLRDGLLVRRLHDQPADRGPDRRQGLGRDRARGRAAAARARRAGAAAGAAPLLLEERQVGRRACGSWTTTSPASGRRTATTTAATPGRRSAIGRTSNDERRFPARSGALADRHRQRRSRRRRRASSHSASTLPMWMPHLPGQHYDVRLTAPDGYQAQRSYSVASSPLDEGEIELTIDRLADGEVSPYFHDVVGRGRPGRGARARSPPTSSGAARSRALLVGGGSGVVPLMAMLRHRRRTMPDLADAARLLGAQRRRT